MEPPNASSREKRAVDTTPDTANVQQQRPSEGHEPTNSADPSGPLFWGQVFQAAIDKKDQPTIDQYTFPRPQTANSESFQPEQGFLSHRGPDTKLDLVGPLSRMMANLYGHSYFVDYLPTNTLERARAASTADAIAQSIWACKVIVVFISPNFHESEWCLKELYTALYRRQVDPSLQAVHIVYCDGMTLKLCNDKPGYAGLGLKDIYGTVFQQGTPLHEFASYQLHKVLYQLIHGNEEGIKPQKIALAEWQKVCRHHFRIPQPLNYFRGREDQFKEITKILKNQSSAAITTHGVGGVGKSQLVISWVQQNQQNYHLVAWVRAEQRFDLQQDLATFGEELGLKYSDNEGLEQRARRTLQAIQKRSTPTSPGLLIFDNAISYCDMLESDWVPALGSHCQWIVTTRDSAGCTDEERVNVGPLDEASSLAIVEYFFKRALAEGEKAKVLEMLRHFDFLPLATVNFAVFAREFGIDDAISQVQDVISGRVYEWRKFSGQDRTSVDAVLQAQINALDEGARTMLQYLSVLAAENVPISLLKSFFDKNGKGMDYFVAMKQLKDRAIVLQGGDKDGVSTHRLLQSNAMGMAQSSDKLEGILTFVAGCLSDTIKRGIDQVLNHDRNYMSIYLPHARVLVGHELPQKSETFGRLLFQLGLVMQNEAQYDRAMELHQTAMAIQGEALGPEHPDYAVTLHSLAAVHERQGRYNKAMELYQTALAIKGEALGQEHPDYATTLKNMAMVHKALDQWELALPLFQQARSIFATAFHDEHPGVVDAQQGIESCQEALRQQPQLGEEEDNRNPA